MSNATETVLLAYTFCNALRVLSYVPQILRIAHDQDGARAISLATWSLWIAANASTMFYAWVNLGDALLAILNGLQVVACLIVVGLTFQKRIAMKNRILSLSTSATGIECLQPQTRSS